MIDTHSHVNFNSFKDDSVEVMQRAIDNNVAVINVGSQFSTSQRAVKMAEEFENTYAAVALHPIHQKQRRIVEEVDKNETVEIISRAEEFNFEKYVELAKSSDKVVAIGENGLDYYHVEDVEKLKDIQKLQKFVFNKHIELANEVNLPMIIHCREAYDDLIEELQNHEVKSRGVVHCFSGNLEQAEKLIDLGFYIGFTGVITFKNKVEALHEIVKYVPKDKILSETDCPYLTPVPFRGERNEPLYVKYVIEKISELKGLSFAEAENITETNAKTLFKI